MALEDQIRDTRKARGLSQQKLAERAGLALSQVGKLEQGAITDPHIGTLRQIAAALDIPVAQLLGESVLSGKAEAAEEEQRRFTDQAEASSRASIQATGTLEGMDAPPTTNPVVDAVVFLRSLGGFEHLAKTADEHERWALAKFATDPLGLVEAFDELAEERERFDQMAEEAAHQHQWFVSRLPPFSKLSTAEQYEWIDAVSETLEKDVEPIREHARQAYNHLLRAGMAAQGYLNGHRDEFPNADEVEARLNEYVGAES